VRNTVKPSKQRHEQSDGKTQKLPEMKCVMSEGKIAIEFADMKI